MAFDTGSPIGSTDARDLYDNAQNLDYAVNQSASRWTDRLGVSRPSWAGMVAYADRGAYAAGIVITGYNEMFLFDGEYYRAAAATVLPYTTTGSWSDDGVDFVSIGDAALRSDLSTGMTGAINGVINVAYFGTLEEARTNSEAAGRTIVVDVPLTEAQSNITAPWPTDRALEIKKGGSIANSTTFTFVYGAIFNAGNTQAFSGTGAVTFNNDVGNPAGWFAIGQVVTFNAGLIPSPNLISTELILGTTSKPDKVYPEMWGAVGDSITDSTIAIQKALDNSRNVDMIAGTYLVSQSIIIDGGRSLNGVNNTKSGRSTIIYSIGTSDIFGTIDTDTDFNGISIRNIRIKGGHAGSWAISSHYPYTYIENVQIENSTGSFLGNGIRLHNDGAVSSMGGWGSRISNCKVVLQEMTQGVTGAELDINGGNVTVEKTEFIFGEVAINIKRGENISILDVNTNKISDETSTTNPPVKAAIVVGNGTSGFDVVNCTISRCYIEGHSRAVIINNAVNTTISDSYINDIGYADPATNGVTADGCIYNSQYSSNTILTSCHIDVRYAFQYHIYESTIGVGFIGISVNNCYLLYNRGASSSSKTNRPAFSSKEDGFANTVYKSIISSITTERLILGNDKSFSVDTTFVTGVGQTIFDIKSGELWEVITNQYDSNVRFSIAYVSKPLSGATPLVSGVVAGTSITTTLSGDSVVITQSSGTSRRMRIIWRLLSNGI